MKSVSYILLILTAIHYSCNNDKTTEIRTHFPLILSVEIDSIADRENSEDISYSFTSTDTIYLKDNEDLKPYLNNFSYISFSGYSMGTTGLEEKQMINALKISANGGLEILFARNITDSGSQPGSSRPPAVYSAIGNILYKEEQLTITASGTTNSAPMDFDIELGLQFIVYANEL